MKRSLLLYAFAFIALASPLSGCARLTIAWASLDVTGPEARPPVLGPFKNDGDVRSGEAWAERRAPALREAFQRSIYGYFPDHSGTRVIEHRIVDPAAFNGAGSLEEYRVIVAATFDGEAADTEEFWIDVLLPTRGSNPAPILLMQTYCPRSEGMARPAVTSGGPGVSCNGGPLSGFLKLALRRYVRSPPIERLLAEGFGLATLYPSEVVPDRRRAGLDALDALAPQRAESDTRWGAIAAWGWLYSRMIDVLEKDRRIDGFVAFGHSRYAKAALVAGAFDPRINAVIANQSGTGGAALSRDKKGETIRQITRAYPHWFATAFDNYAGREDDLPVDQHQLLALIAPRPVFLGNARRDVWSDPNGTFRAARGASPVYRLFGREGMTQAGMDDFDPHSDIAYWIRPGMHGIVNADWPPILEFLQAHVTTAGR